jgi:hypothetical protein
LNRRITLGQRRLAAAKGFPGRERPRAFLDHDRREQGIHPPQRQPNLFFRLGLLRRLDLRPVETQRRDAHGRHRGQQHEQAGREQETDVERAGHSCAAIM